MVQSVSSLAESVRFGVIFYDAQLVLFPAKGPPLEAKPEVKAAATNWVTNMQRGNGSCSLPALLKSIAWVNQPPARRRTVVYLSSGLCSCPGYDMVKYKTDVLNEVTSRNGGRASINTFCIGPPGGVDEWWMHELAKLNRGKYTRLLD